MTAEPAADVAGGESGFTAAHADAVSLLRAWRAPDAEQERWRRQYLALCLARGPSALDRRAAPEHLTASCVVLDAARSRVLLVHHRKAGVWVQPGGHVEAGDAGLAAAARREVIEETGVDLPVVHPFDLHHHGLGHAFGTCAEHLDVTFLAVVDDPAAEGVTVSDESDDVAWWPLAALPAGIVPDLPARLAQEVWLSRSGSGRA